MLFWDSIPPWKPPTSYHMTPTSAHHRIHGLDAVFPTYRHRGEKLHKTTSCHPVIWVKGTFGVKKNTTRNYWSTEKTPVPLVTWVVNFWKKTTDCILKCHEICMALSSSQHIQCCFQRPPSILTHPRSTPCLCPCRPVSFRQIDCTKGGSMTLFERRNVFGTWAEIRCRKFGLTSSVKQKIGMKIRDGIMTSSGFLTWTSFSSRGDLQISCTRAPWLFLAGRSLEFDSNSWWLNRPWIRKKFWWIGIGTSYEEFHHLSPLR